MNVFCPNDINIYDLSGGKKLPDFLSERKRRDLLRKDVSLRKRIDLIQDFNMPTVCTRVHVSKDGQYIYTAGTYKPRLVSRKFKRIQKIFIFGSVLNFKNLGLSVSRSASYR